tara:strand:- start:708 stop:881 length:174 start_codon:yes stop_codon:yes gene_type:complete
MDEQEYYDKHYEKFDEYMKDRRKIYERNPDTGVIRWRYVGESPDEYGWPHYGNILKQ